MFLNGMTFTCIITVKQMTMSIIQSITNCFDLQQHVTQAFITQQSVLWAVVSALLEATPPEVNWPTDVSEYRV